MGETLHQRPIMGRDQHRRAHLVQFLEEIEQPDGHAVIDIARRLVCEQELRPADHRTGNGHALLLSAGQGMRQGIEMTGQADPFEQFRHIFADRRFASPRDAQRQRDIIQRAQMLDQPEILKHDADTPAQRRDAVPADAGRVLAEQGQPAARRLQAEIHQLQQARFSSSTGPGDKLERALLDRETDIAEDRRAPGIAELHLVKLDHGAARLPLPTPVRPANMVSRDFPVAQVPMISDRQRH